ncbi:OB-fold nucleic acid binding domain-containing protein [Isoptericola sp. b441]|uniref:OB-fold nucleic acid binding domain-containing protein n=1 Tax=Actinotalea lenta TaxID=3064654 RepID=A0ABT9DAH8_9CELL|nr:MULTISPECIES: OB-fold nucleic acid binding domain-containing protein [unclassified Isoptericola]MDO8107917.1 OB-fold nucleic acid binding domain-containing protein [Isoptericola sp. b441]MDO8120416.1 OB-fold nucleic acid binding domain-containing protein [Isoptericola sp. b490]
MSRRTPTAHRNGVRSALRGMIASRNEIEAAEERLETRKSGCTAVAELAPRKRAQVSGVLRSVRLRPTTEVPALEAELYDGSGSLRVVFLGRREVAGIEPGRRLRLEGLVCYQSGHATVYNPRYELVPRPGE